MTPEQVLLQLGVSGAVLFVGYRIALVLINKWATAEAARTKVLADGFTALVSKVDNHHDQDLESHRDLDRQITEVNTKLDIAFNLTPVRGMKAPDLGAEAEEEDTGPESPHALEAQSAPTKSRPPTQGGQYHLQPAKRRG